MGARTKGFAVTLGISTLAAVVSWGLFFGLVAGRGGASGPAALARWTAVLLPQALATAAAGLLSRSFAAVALDAFALFLPQAASVVLGFLMFAHPGGPAGLPTLLGTGLFWLEIGALYLATLVLVGMSAALARLVLGRR